MEITPVQAALLIGKSERTIQRWIQQKKLPAHTLADGSYRVNGRVGGKRGNVASS